MNIKNKPNNGPLTKKKIEYLYPLNTLLEKSLMASEIGWNKPKK
jgi:hypothetical protein